MSVFSHISRLHVEGFFKRKVERERERERERNKAKFLEKGRLYLAVLLSKIYHYWSAANY